MFKQWLILLFFLSGFVAPSQVINFPDIHFKARLMQSSVNTNIASDSNGNYMVIDANGDNEIEVAEALAVYYLDINNVGLNPTLNNYITNLSGLENFLNLEYFKATLNEIIEFNFVNLTNLKVLILNANSTLNLIELDGLVSLERFECLSCGNVTSLDFSSCISLNGIATSSSMIQYINLKNGKNTLQATYTPGIYLIKSNQGLYEAVKISFNR